MKIPAIKAQMASHRGGHDMDNRQVSRLKATINSDSSMRKDNSRCANVAKICHCSCSRVNKETECLISILILVKVEWDVTVTSSSADGI